MNRTMRVPGMRRTALARARSERGASLVEFALIVPLIFALVLGIATGGLAYNRKISITNSVREGARFGATLACDATCAAASPTTWVTQVKQRVADVSGGELATTDVCAWVGLAAGATDCGVTDPSGAQAAGSWVVKVSASKNASFEVIFFRQTLTLTSRTADRYERSGTYGQSSS